MKVTIAGGAGGVGASTAFNLVLMRGGQEIVLVDDRPGDDHLARDGPRADRRGVARLRRPWRRRADVLDADILVLISATPLTVGTSRLDYLTKNASIVDEVTNGLPAEWPGVLIVVTNPVDPLVTRLATRTGIERRRVVGYTLNDSLRLRTGLTKALGVAPGSVEAWVVGEHGDLSVPLYDRVRVDGVPVDPPTSRSPSPRSTGARGTCGTSHSTPGARRPGPRVSGRPHGRCDRRRRRRALAGVRRPRGRIRHQRCRGQRAGHARPRRRRADPRMELAPAELAALQASAAFVRRPSRSL